MATPIGSNSKNVDTVSLNIIDFLTLIFLDNNFIGKPSGAHRFHSLGKGLLNVNFSASAIKIVCSNAYNQIIAKLSSPFQKSNMTIMKHIVRTVCNDFHHSNQAFYLQKTLR